MSAFTPASTGKTISVPRTNFSGYFVGVAVPDVLAFATSLRHTIEMSIVAYQAEEIVGERVAHGSITEAQIMASVMLGIEDARQNKGKMLEETELALSDNDG